MPSNIDSAECVDSGEGEGHTERVVDKARAPLIAIFGGTGVAYVAALTLAGIGLGGPISGWASDLLSPWVETRTLVYFEVGIRSVCGLIAFLFALRSLRWILQFVIYLETMSLLDKAAAAIGTLMGFAIAVLATSPFASLPGVGLPIRLLAIIFFVPLGIVFALSAKDQIVHVFPSLATPPMASTAHSLPEGAKLLDTNIIIDGRIADIAAAGFLEGLILVPGFVLTELRTIADSADEVKRARGKRGLEILNKLQKLPNVSVIIYEDYPEDDNERDDVDVRLVKLARARNAAVVTNDHGVAQLAQLHGVRVLNVNELAQALRPAYLPGEELVVTIVREGKEEGQGVGYLDDGTMVVVEGAAKHVGRSVAAVVTSSLQTSAGKMIFADLKSDQPVQQQQTGHSRGGKRSGR